MMLAPSEPPDLQALSGFEEGSFTAMLPGKPPDIFGDRTPKWIPAGAKLRFQVHYAKVDKPQTDRTRVGFYLASSPPKGRCGDWTCATDIS